MFSDNICLQIHSGIPIGQWADEVNTGYGFNIHYVKDMGTLYLFTGIDMLSMSTDNILYTVNLISIPLGASIDIVKTPYFTWSSSIHIAPAILNRHFNNGSEWGFNERMGIETGIVYSDIAKLKPSIRIGYERYKLIDGENFIYLGFGLSFDYLSLLSGL